MAKKKENPWVALYKKERAKYLRNVNRLRKRGYDVSKLEIPAIPQRISEASVNKIIRLNEQRYDKATRIHTYFTTDKKTGKKELQIEKVSGKKARKLERKESSRKGQSTKLHNNLVKHYKKLYHEAVINEDEDSQITYRNRLYSLEHGGRDYYKDHGYTSDEYGDVIDYSEPKTEIEKIQEDVLAGKYDDLPEIDISSGGYVIDMSTGEIIEKTKIPDNKKKDSRYVVMSASESDEAVFDKAMHNFEVMMNYQSGHGGKKHDARARNNAEEIRDFIKQQYEKDPKRTADVLRSMEAHGSYRNAEYLYYDDGSTSFAETFFNVYFDKRTGYYESYDDTYDDDEYM